MIGRVGTGGEWQRSHTLLKPAPSHGCITFQVSAVAPLRACPWIRTFLRSLRPARRGAAGEVLRSAAPARPASICDHFFPTDRSLKKVIDRWRPHLKSFFISLATIYNGNTCLRPTNELCLPEGDRRLHSRRRSVARSADDTSALLLQSSIAAIQLGWVWVGRVFNRSPSGMVV